MSQLNLYPNASTIDAVNDELVIWTNSLSAVQNINRNTFLNLSSQPVGLTDSQTLTNKTLTSPTVSSPTLSGTLTGTYTIGGTPTFPSSVTQNTVSQTLTNKTLTSPTITSPTITNATISADTLTGYTVSNTGTIYGIPVTTGTISASYLTASTITNTQVAAAGLYTSKVYNPYKFSAFKTAAQTTVSGVATKLVFDSKNFDTGSNFDNTTNYRFTAPIAGFYQFNASYGVSGSNGYTVIYFYKNNATISSGTQLYISTANEIRVSHSTLLQLSANDYIEVFYYVDGVKTLDTGTTVTNFSGYLVSAT